MEERFADTTLNVANVADLVGVNQTHFSITFKKHHLVAASDFLRRLRLRAVHRHLGNGDGRAIREVARSCGFVSYASFRKQYEREYGHSPQVDRFVHAPPAYARAKALIDQAAEMARCSREWDPCEILTIEAVISEIGARSVGRTCAHFRRHYGLTMAAYIRKQLPYRAPSDWLIAARQFIRERVVSRDGTERPLPMHRLAKHLGRAEALIHNHFLLCFGETPSQYAARVRQQRMARWHGRTPAARLGRPRKAGASDSAALAART